MSMTLVLWKAPLVGDSGEAKALFDRYDNDDDDSAFEPSADIGLVWDELLRRYPDDGSADLPDTDPSPWSSFPPEVTDRLLILDIRWSAADAVINDIVSLARKHELVLYDPQGPDVHLPSDPEDVSEEESRLGFSAYALAVGVTLLGVLLVAAGWNLSIPVLDWLLIVAGGFIVGVGMILLYAFIVQPADP